MNDIFAIPFIERWHCFRVIRTHPDSPTNQLYDVGQITFLNLSFLMYKMDTIFILHGSWEDKYVFHASTWLALSYNVGLEDTHFMFSS